jgi:hypothetical protein
VYAQSHKLLVNTSWSSDQWWHRWRFGQRLVQLPVATSVPATTAYATCCIIGLFIRPFQQYVYTCTTLWSSDQMISLDDTLVNGWSLTVSQGTWFWRPFQNRMKVGRILGVFKWKLCGFSQKVSVRVAQELITEPRLVILRSTFWVPKPLSFSTTQ